MIDETEWQLQERAKDAERAGEPAQPDGARVLRYRRVCRELALPPPDRLPTNFPHAAAERIARIAREQQRSQATFRRTLFGWYACLFGGGVAFALVIYGRAWWRLLDATLLRTPAGRWLLALAVCLLLSQLAASGATRLISARRAARRAHDS